MVTLIRVEAEGPALNNVVRDLDALANALLPEAGGGLHVHDEHYERVTDTLFKGRRVYRVGEKRPGANIAPPFPTGTSGGTSMTFTS